MLKLPPIKNITCFDYLNILSNGDVGNQYVVYCPSNCLETETTIYGSSI